MHDSPSEEELWAAARSPDNHCFACGPGNPSGLHLHFTRRDDGSILGNFMPGDWHAGWAGVVHGGILATALDEAMAYSVFMTGSKCLTAKMEIRYLAGASRGDELTVEGRIVRDHRRLAEVEARVLRGGQVIAEARGKFLKVGPLDLESIFGPRLNTAEG